MKRYLLLLLEESMGNAKYKDSEGKFKATPFPTKPEDENLYSLFDDDDDFGAITIGTLVSESDCKSIEEIASI